MAGNWKQTCQNEALGVRIQNYGVRKHYQMFTPRQLTAMVTLSDLIKDIRADVLRDAEETGSDGKSAEIYSTTVVTVSRLGS